VIHRVHDRYLLEVVEGLGLCPFARRSREQGHVHRPLVYGDAPTPEATTARLRDVLTVDPDAEIVLLTFVGASPSLPWPTARAFDDFVKNVRPCYDQLGDPMFFMVGFHPGSGRPDPDESPPRLTPDSLVPKLRRTPDPVIQCVRAEVLQQARITAQRAAHAKLIAQTSDPRIRAILERSVQTDSVLSADIARHNYEAVAQGDGRRQLEAVIADIQADRERAYAEHGPLVT